jgi:hypothetical protein
MPTAISSYESALTKTWKIIHKLRRAGREKAGEEQSSREALGHRMRRRKPFHPVQRREHEEKSLSCETTEKKTQKRMYDEYKLMEHILIYHIWFSFYGGIFVVIYTLPLHQPSVIDYRCSDVRFLVSAMNSVTVSSPDSLFSCEAGANPGIRRWKSTYLNELDVRKPLVVSVSERSEELRLYNLV